MFILSPCQGYSFVAPSILFKRNAATMDPVQFLTAVDQPGVTSIARSAMMKVVLTVNLAV